MKQKSRVWFLCLWRLLALPVCVAALLGGCSGSARKLPILGKPVIVANDTVYPQIKPFSFISQDSLVITEKTFEGKIYVADFIFLSCPSICPKMTSELGRVYEVYKSHPGICFLSHTIDPERDSPERLRSYTDAMGIDSKKWFFVTGDKDSIYAIAEQSYYTPAYAERTAPGGYIHGGGLLLIDTNRHIRGVYDGMKESETKRLIKDIAILLEEQIID